MVYKAPTQTKFGIATVKVNDTSTSIDINVLTPPVINGTASAQSIAPGSTTHPFANVNIADGNDDGSSAFTFTITVTDSGKATDADGLLAGGQFDKGLSDEGKPSLYKSGAGTYGFAAKTYSLLTSELRDLVFTPTAVGAGETRTTNFALGVTHQITTASNIDGSGNSLSASDSTTSVVTVGPASTTANPPTTNPPVMPPTDPTTNPPVTLPVTPSTNPPVTPPAAPNFLVTNVSIGEQSSNAGATYAGPVSGISNEFVLVTPNNLNILALTPNVFIHSGSGTDAIDVSRSNGNNILDGSTGSNFLTGGAGFDTFFLDDRSLTANVFSTIVNFHASDNATVFGINPTNFTQTVLDNQGATDFKGLDF